MTMARRKTTRRRSPKSFKILNALEALAYGQIISVGITGGGLMEFVTGAQDLGQKTVDLGIGGFRPMSGVDSVTQISGQDQISLSDFAAEPTLAISQMTSNFTQNIVPMASAALFTGLAFNVGRRVLRRPINNINRNIMKPLRGAGVKL